MFSHFYEAIHLHQPKSTLNEPALHQGRRPLFERAIHRAAGVVPRAAALPQAAELTGTGVVSGCIKEPGCCVDVLVMHDALAASGRFERCSRLSAAAHSVRESVGLA